MNTMNSETLLEAIFPTTMTTTIISIIEVVEAQEVVAQER